jgi:hypothetical protein
VLKSVKNHHHRYHKQVFCVPWKGKLQHNLITNSPGKKCISGEIKTLTSSMNNKIPYFLCNLTSSGHGAKWPSMLNMWKMWSKQRWQDACRPRRSWRAQTGKEPELLRWLCCSSNKVKRSRNWIKTKWKEKNKWHCTCISQHLWHSA